MALLTTLPYLSDPQGFRAQGHGGVMERAGGGGCIIFPATSDSSSLTASSKDLGPFPEWLLP